MVLEHFLLTRFSYRGGANRTEGHAPTWNAPDPLARHRLEKRFKLFELFCVPSVLAQTTNDFTWILLIDAKMEARDRNRVRALTRRHSRTQLVEVAAVEDLPYLYWLQPYVTRPDVTHIATTNVDNDDLLAPSLLAYTQAYLRRRDDERSLPSCLVVGCAKSPHWDFLPTRRAPLGHVKARQGGDGPLYTGYTVCCKQPEYDVSVLAFNHAKGGAYFDPHVTVPGATQAQLRRAAGRAGEDWRAWSPEQHLHLVESEHPSIVVLNHVENDDFTRLFRQWANRRPVTGPDDFPGMPIAFDKVPAVIADFRRSPSSLIRYVRRRAHVRWGKWGWRTIWRVLVLAVNAPVWFMVGEPEKRRT